MLLLTPLNSTRPPAAHLPTPLKNGKPAVFVRLLLRRPGTSHDAVSIVVESPWKVEVGSVTRSLGCFFTEQGELSRDALDKVMLEAVAPIIAGVGTRAKTS